MENIYIWKKVIYLWEWRKLKLNTVNVIIKK